MAMNTDDIIFETQLHPIIFSQPIILALIGLILLIFLPVVYLAAWLFVGVGIAGIFMFYGALSFSSFQIRRRSIVIQTGVLARQTMNLPISKIETVEIRQSLLGALLNYGTVILIGTGGTYNLFQNIARPLTVRRALEQQINAE